MGNGDDYTYTIFNLNIYEDCSFFNLLVLL